MRLARAIARKVGSLIIGSSCFSRPGSWPFDSSPASAVKHDIDADYSHHEQGEHEEQRDRHPAGRPCRGRQDGQKRAHAHQHTERNQGQRQTLTDGGSLTRGFLDQLLSSAAVRKSLFISRIACRAVGSTLTLVAHFCVLKHTASPFEVVAVRDPSIR